MEIVIEPNKDVDDEIVYSKEEIEKIDPKRRKEYYRILFQDILKKNPKGVTVSQIHALTGVGKKTISSHLDFLVATRDAYKWEYGPKTILYFPNGRLAHPVEDELAEIGGKYYAFRHLVSDFGDFIQIQEKKEEGNNIFTTVGGIIIRKNVLKKFIERLQLMEE